MKKYFILAAVLFVSCNSDKSGEKNIASVSSLKAQPAYEIKCEEIKSNLTKESVVSLCDDKSLTNEAVFLRKFNKEKFISPYELSVNNEVEIEVKLPDEIIEGEFVLISKNGKEISNVARYEKDNARLYFYELEDEDFINHKVYLKTLSLKLENNSVVNYERSLDKNCVTGKLSFEDYENLVQPEGCQGLREKRIYTGAIVQKPVFEEIENATVGLRKVPQIIISKPKPRNWKPYRVIQVQTQFKVRYVDYFEEKLVELSDVYMTTEVGGLEVLKKKECYDTGIVEYHDLDIKKGRWFKVRDDIVISGVTGEIEVAGEVLDAVEDYKKQECFDLNPRPIGYVYIQE